MNPTYPNTERDSVSKVLHVRNVSPDTSHEELISFVSQFGTVVAICFLSKFSQALVEMDTVAAATNVIVYSRSNPTFIRGREVHFSFSKSQHINTSQAQQNSTAAPSGMHNILLCTILNPLFNINVDVMHAIMSPYGSVQRIVIFNKNGVQALVEFDNSVNATQAKSALDGKDIYAGSCTLKIEFSKADRLNVHTNNDKSRDYTNPSLPTMSGQHAQQLMQAYGGIDPYALYRSGGLSLSGGLSMSGGISMGGMGGMMPSMAGIGMAGLGGIGFDTNSRSVLIIYGLDEQVMNCDRIFNLFCQYGNVLKVKLLTNKKGSALVQMGDNMMADQALQHLQGAQLFGQALQVQYSKHPFIADSRTEQADPNAPPSVPTSKDFSSSPLNRFSHNLNAFRHIYRPSPTLYFSNAPKEYQDAEISQLFTNLNAQPPTAIKFFALPNNNEATSERRVGLMEFPDVVTATESLILVNNTKVNAHTLKLSFSSNSIHQQNTTQPSQGNQE